MQQRTILLCLMVFVVVFSTGCVTEENKHENNYSAVETPDLETQLPNNEANAINKSTSDYQNNADIPGTEEHQIIQVYDGATGNDAHSEFNEYIEAGKTANGTFTYAVSFELNGLVRLPKDFFAEIEVYKKGANKSSFIVSTVLVHN